jgi:hypothetical protein
MSGKWCDEGESSVGNVYLKAGAQPDYYLGLYNNSTEPAEDAIMSSGITEVDVVGSHGYARIQLGDADWTESPQGVFTNLQKTFTASGGDWADAYGYFITTTATGTAGLLIAVEHFSDGPYVVNDGWSVKVTAKITVS